MPGKHISDEQRRDFMDHLANGNSVEVAASKSGLSRASGYNIVKEVKSGGKKPRARTRPDPLEGIFDSQAAPILKAVPNIRTVALWREITRLNPQLDSSVKRTFQRRVRQWRAEHGVDKEVIFRQGKEAGRMGISDFTKAASLGVTIDREALEHRLYHFRLPWSGFTYVCVVTGGESWSAFSEGLQNALGQLGGVPRECRTDSLSAAFRNLHKSEIEDVTRSYRGLCSHYGMRATRNNKGVAHENGAIESAHGHLKSEIKDALELRGSRDFGDMDSYRDFIAEAVGKINVRHSARIDTERLVLRPLPKRRVADYSRSSVRVTSLSGFTLKGVFIQFPHALSVTLWRRAATMTGLRGCTRGAAVCWCCRGGAGGRMKKALTLSTTTTSFIHCAASPWRLQALFTEGRCFPARSIGAALRRRLRFSRSGRRGG